MDTILEDAEDRELPLERPDSAFDVLTALKSVDVSDAGAGSKPAQNANSFDSLAGDGHPEGVRMPQFCRLPPLWRYQAPSRT